MKGVILVFSFVLVAALAISPADLEKWNVIHKKCNSNPVTYVDNEIFEKLKRGEKVDLPANFGDHAFCMLKLFDLQDASGKTKPDVVKTTVQKNVHDAGKIDTIVNQCSANKETPEKTALHMFKCFGENDINIGQK